MLNDGHDADDVTVDGLPIGHDVTNGVVIIVRLDGQMCILLVLVGIPLRVRLHGTTTFIYT